MSHETIQRNPRKAFSKRRVHSIINTKIGTVTYENIKRNPNVALAIAEHSNPYNMVTINGKVTGPVHERHIHQLAYKYLG
jgi:uncharacterized pyridoxamine 5'-phosphate oxidase family protein